MKALLILAMLFAAISLRFGAVTDHMPFPSASRAMMPCAVACCMTPCTSARTIAIPRSSYGTFGDVASSRNTPSAIRALTQSCDRITSMYSPTPSR